MRLIYGVIKSKTFRGGSHHCQRSSSLLSTSTPLLIFCHPHLESLFQDYVLQSTAIPQGYRELTPSFRSTIPIELTCALKIVRQYSPFCLISSLDSGKFTPRFLLVRAFSFRSFFSTLACVFQTSHEHSAFPRLFSAFSLSKRPIHHFMSPTPRTSLFHVIHQILIPCLKN